MDQVSEPAPAAVYETAEPQAVTEARADTTSQQQALSATKQPRRWTPEEAREMGKRGGRPTNAARREKLLYHLQNLKPADSKAVARTIIEGAKQGDDKKIAMLLERLYGLPGRSDSLTLHADDPLADLMRGIAAATSQLAPPIDAIDGEVRELDAPA